jgi:transposase
VPKDHPLRIIRAIADEAFEVWSSQFRWRYADSGWVSIPPEKLVRSLLLQAFYTIASERQLIEQLDYNLLFRWFVGLSMDAPQWDPAVFSKDRERFLSNHVTSQFLASVLCQPRIKLMLSDDHFFPDGRLIEAWAGKLPVPAAKDGPEQGSKAECDSFGENGERLPYYPARPRVAL